MRSLVIGEVAKADIVDALRWSGERFGEAVRVRYETLIALALRNVLFHASITGVLTPDPR